MGRYRPYIIVYSSIFLGLSSITLFFFFLFLGSFSIFNFGLPKAEALLIDVCLSLVFFAQHSIMIRREVKKRLTLLVPEEYNDALYSIASSLVLIPVILFWQKTPDLIVTVSGIYRWIVRIPIFLSIVCFMWAIKSLETIDSFGINKIFDHIHNREQKPIPLSVQGPYRWVRHPLYLIALVMIWDCPDLSTDKLLFNVLWSAWMLFAIILEERDLVSDFGDHYRKYQAKVPMIIPYRIPQVEDNG